MERRFAREHLKAIVDPKHLELELPGYSILRKLGARNLVCIALFGVPNATEFELRTW